MYEDRIMRLARQKQQGLGSLGGPKKPFGQRQQPWKSSEGLSRDVNIEKELNKFQIRANEPTARAAEQQVFDDYRRQGLYPWNLHSRPSVNFEGGRRDIEGWEVRPVNIEKIPPKIQSGIFNTDAGHEMLADSYAPQHLLQMYHDALDAGNEDEAERLLFDIQLRYPQLLETRV